MITLFQYLLLSLNIALGCNGLPGDCTPGCNSSCDYSRCEYVPQNPAQIINDLPITLYGINDANCANPTFTAEELPFNLPVSNRLVQELDDSFDDSYRKCQTYTHYNSTPCCTPTTQNQGYWYTGICSTAFYGPNGCTGGWGTRTVACSLQWWCTYGPNCPQPCCNTPKPQESCYVESGSWTIQAPPQPQCHSCNNTEGQKFKGNVYCNLGCCLGPQPAIYEPLGSCQTTQFHGDWVLYNYGWGQCQPDPTKGNSCGPGQGIQYRNGSAYCSPNSLCNCTQQGQSYDNCCNPADKPAMTRACDYYPSGWHNIYNYYHETACSGCGQTPGTKIHKAKCINSNESCCDPATKPSDQSLSCFQCCELSSIYPDFLGNIVESNAPYSYDENGYQIKKYATMTCPSNLSGQSMLHCNWNYTWVGSPPVCQCEASYTNKKCNTGLGESVCGSWFWPSTPVGATAENSGVQCAISSEEISCESSHPQKVLRSCSTSGWEDPSELICNCN